MDRHDFHYATDAPILNNFAFFSAAYAVREGRWNDVEIQIFQHPKHAARTIYASVDSDRCLQNLRQVQTTNGAECDR